ncbi:MAG TPA: DPP IV N-terminal domain-containing protein [Terriglobales bacterium]|nr:DPP IV N-terminal domain-containing protein [Terriglobales bacterium]
MHRRLLFLPALGGLCLLAAAQTAPRTLTAADYAHAEKYLSYNVNPLVLNGPLSGAWMADGRFWYSVNGANGPRYVLVNPARATREPAFDAVKLAAALSQAAGETFKADNLHLSALSFSADGRTVSFNVGRRRWSCDRQGASCETDSSPAPHETAIGRGGFGGGRGAGGRGGPPLSVSPDGKRAVYIKDWNLWLRDLASHQDTQLTFDGVENFGYATDNAGWTSSDRAIVLWSPDSSKIATYQQDQRGVGKLYLVPVVVGHPQLTTQIYPLPGDKIITTIQRVIIDLNRPAHQQVIRLKMPPDQHRSTTSDNLAWGPDQDVQWSPDGSHLAFVSTSRDHKQEWVRLADASSGDVRTLLEDTVTTQYQGGQSGSTFRYLPTKSAFLWYSQKVNLPGMPGGTAAGLGQLYLYDLNGKLLRQITSPHDGNVDSVVKVDEKNDQVYYIATAVPGSNPYYQHLYRASLDGGQTELLTPEDANHTISFSPDGDYFVDTYSTPDQPPVSVLRTTAGKLVMRLEKADISRLLATGWKPPIQVKVKARDGATDIYGLMFTPFKLTPGRKYPFINHIYPGPQTGSVGSRSFSAARGDDEALAQLGFVVVELDGMGTPWRGQKFHDAYYGNMKDNTLPDQVKGMKELAARYPFIDINKAGIFGHSGGGDATADAMFRYADFFKVGISESGNHDQREYEDDWGERYMGLDVPTGVDKNTTYTGQSNEEAAAGLKGHLLLAHGTMDNNVPMNNTLLVVDALIKANKDFDLVLLPNKPHGYGDDSAYMMRRRWDYFVRYLLGATPPHEYKMHEPQR